jgi:hypothetical protein
MSESAAWYSTSQPRGSDKRHLSDKLRTLYKFHMCEENEDNYRNYYYYYYYLLWLCSPARAMASSSTSFRDHTQRHATDGRTPLDE